MVADRDLEDPRLNDLPIDRPELEDELDDGDVAYDNWNENVRWEA